MTRTVSTTFDGDLSLDSRRQKCPLPKRRRGLRSSRAPECSKSCMSWTYGLPNSMAARPGGGPFAATGWRGLYTDPEFAGRGVGVGLLEMFERLMCERGIRAVRAEASSNAMAFYLRRGYRANGRQSPNGAWPIAKELL
ncbi:GNAT family N-acetyltransferase [Bradyrhizobium sp. RDI18]|uniref:GNAT family N-acetyltransferase n=1 Tax=Bradyrhizobium sp. RDI18 TaxID=3367400 RepID=UPI0037213A7A